MSLDLWHLLGGLLKSGFHGNFIEHARYRLIIQRLSQIHAFFEELGLFAEIAAVVEDTFRPDPKIWIFSKILLDSIVLMYYIIIVLLL